MLLDRIVRGELPPGTNLVETRLSEELGVSRTPLRAALAFLERDGLVVSRPGRGWRVAPLIPEEAKELYPILHSLEELGMRSAFPYDKEVLDRLRELNEEIRECGDDPQRTVERNLRWHETLVGGCENSSLLDLLANLRHQVTRYEYAFFRGADGVAASTLYHDRIHEALAEGRVEEAVVALREHWLSDLDFMLPDREDGGAGSHPALEEAS